MNFRKYDIVQFKSNGKLKVGIIVDFNIHAGLKRVKIVLHDAKKNINTNGFSRGWSWGYMDYPKESVNMEDIVKVIKRKRGKKYKKVPRVFFPDTDGNEDKDD